jgi:hypothetical protein
MKGVITMDKIDLIEFGIDEFVDLALGASEDWQKRFLNITQKELNNLWEEETLTELQEKLFLKYANTSDKELQSFIDELL